LGSPVSIVGGTAVSGTIAAFTTGQHTVLAFYSGGGGFEGSVSTALAQVVEPPIDVAVRVESSRNPSQLTQPVHFTATIVVPGAIAPTGTVQFHLDGASFDGPVAVAGGVASSQTTATLGVGEHAVEAVYSGDGRFAGTSSALVQVVKPPNPVIASVHDVPHDQGGRVSLTWNCGLDQPG